MAIRLGKCSLCNKPAVGAINATANAAASTPAVWELRCDEHNPYWNSLAEVIRIARDGRYSDEYVGNVLRATLGEAP